MRRYDSYQRRVSGNVTIREDKRWLTIFQCAATCISGEHAVGKQRSEKEDSCNAVLEVRQTLIFSHLAHQCDTLVVCPVVGTFEEGPVRAVQRPSREFSQALGNPTGMSHDLVCRKLVVAWSIESIDDISLDGCQLRTVLKMLGEQARGTKRVAHSLRGRRVEVGIGDSKRSTK